jgi:HemY protein
MNSIMVRLIIYLFTIAAVASGAVWMANEPGSVNLVWHGWRVDTSVGVLVAATIASVLVILFVLRVVSALSGTVRAFSAARKERRVQRGLTALGDGFAAVHAGQGALAQSLAKEASKLLGNNSAVLVLRKEAAGLGGDSCEMQAAAMALLNRPQTELTALRTLANKALNDGDVVGALRHAQKSLARKDAPPWALNMVLDVQISMGRWADALSALETKLGKTVFQPGVYQSLKSKLLVQEANRALKNGDAAAAATAAKKAMNLPEPSSEAVAAYARAMTSQGKGRTAASIVEKAWRSSPHTGLLAAYRALVPGESALDWAKRALKIWRRPHLITRKPAWP